MKIVYMGTPDFAVPPLRALVEAEHEIAAVVTQPDKQKDRGKKVQLSPVKETALAYGLSVHQPDRLRNNPDFAAELAALEADCFVVAAYGKILPKEILQLPSLGCINIHGSLLPKYRGAAPVHRAILAGEPVTGVTIMYMTEALDAGDMLSSRQTQVGGKTAAQLYAELSEMGAQLLIQTLRDLQNGTARRVRQDESLACYAPMLTKEEGRMDFARPSAMLERQVRGLNPWPSAYTTYNGVTVKIWESEVIDSVQGAKTNACAQTNGSEEMKTGMFALGSYGEVIKANHASFQNSGGERAADNAPALSPVPGTILHADAKGITVAAGEGMLLIKKLQFPGKKPMNVKEYLLGNKMEAGTRFV